MFAHCKSIWVSAEMWPHLRGYLHRHYSHLNFANDAADCAGSIYLRRSIKVCDVAHAFIDGFKSGKRNHKAQTDQT